MSVAKVGTIDLYYDEQGSGDPLLLVMGLAADSAAWMFQVPDFARHHRTIVFDNRGVGRSAKPPGPYTIHEMADDAVGLLDALGITRAHVVGVSMGGMIAQVVAITHPERVLTLTSNMSTTGAGDVEPPTPEALAVLTALPGETFEERLDQAMRTRRLLHGP